MPYIEATSDTEAWYGLGFAQGQDRAFQIEMIFRIGRGTMAEILGPEAVPIDRLSRRIGFWDASVRQLAVLSPEVREAFDAFVLGLYDGATTGCRRPAHEFALLRTRPSRFEAADVLAGLKYTSFAISSWSGKLTRQIVLREDGPEAVAALSNAYADWIPVIAPTGQRCGEELDRLGEDLLRLAQPVASGGASNNWVVDSSRSATGRPMLANDPHFSPVLPNPWYLAHVRTPEWGIVGACFVGLPAFPAGHNGKMAWGITAGVADDTDLFLEDVGPDGWSVRQGDRFVPCEVRREIIEVKGEADRIEDVLVTPRGPIVSPALEGSGEAISMCATWMAARPLRGLFELHRAGDLEEFREAFRHWPMASLNLVYADTTDTISWQLVGDVPRRRHGWGTMPAPGWDPDSGWEAEPIPYDEMPSLTNPEEGFLATANNKPLREGEGPYIGRDWADGYRQARIVELLASRRDWDLDGMQEIQADELAIPWREMREQVLAAPAGSEATRLALSLLEEWDGVVEADSAAATVYEFFLSELAHRIVRAKAPRSAEWAMGKVFNILIFRSFFGIRRVSHLVRLLREQPRGWLPQPWPLEIAEALATVIRRLRRAYGPRPQHWRWGRVRRYVLEHLVHMLGTRRPLEKVYNLDPLPCGGDSETINAAERTLADPTLNPIGMANMRAVIDVGNWEESRFVLAGGQSGNPLSPNYGDQLPLWQRAKTLRLAWSPEAVRRGTRTTLRLIPSQLQNPGVVA